MIPVFTFDDIPALPKTIPSWFKADLFALPLESMTVKDKNKDSLVTLECKEVGLDKAIHVTEKGKPTYILKGTRIVDNQIVTPIKVTPRVLEVLTTLIHLSHPKFFLLEISPVKARSNERAVYTLISSKDFKKKLGIEKGTSSAPTPHERRSHLRRLSTEGGYYKENKILVVPALWVGPTEKIVGTKRYTIKGVN